MTNRSEAGLFRFNGFELDAASGELRTADRCLALQPQPFKVLAMLVARSGRVVTREEIRQQLWSTGTFVDFEGSLNFCIRQIRKVLGEDARKPRYIETLHRRGYRFLAPVSCTAESQGAGDGVPLTSRTPRFTAGPIQRPITLAVLPLRDLNGSTQVSGMAEGITELLTTYLSTNHALRVASRTTTLRYKGRDKPLSRIAKELGVERVLEGAVAHSGRRVRITARLIDPTTDQSEWVGCYEAELRDYLDVQDHIASAVTRDTAAHLTPGVGEHRTNDRPVAAASHSAYLQGRHYLNRRTEKDLTRAVEYFQRALGDAPEDALAYAGLADAYILSYIHGGPCQPWEMYTRAKAAAHKALQLNEGLADAHATLAYCTMLSDWNWDVAESGFRRALELDPRCVSAHQWYADLLTAVGRHDEAIEQIQVASELDPLSVQVSADVGWILLYANRHDDAIERYRRVLEIDGDFFLAHWGLGLAYAQVGMFSEAIDSLEGAICVTERTPTMLAALAQVFARSGRKNSALQVFSELRDLSRRRYISAYDMATIAWSLGNQGQAISWLERACSERSSYLAYLQVDSRFKNLRMLPPSRAVIRRMGFAQA